MILSFPYGGLGNQLFGYAFARAIQEKTGEKIYLSPKWFHWYYKKYKKSNSCPNFIADCYLIKNENIIVTNSFFISAIFGGYHFITRFFFKYTFHQNIEKLEQEQFLNHVKQGIIIARNEKALCHNINELDLCFNQSIKYIEGLFQWGDVIAPIREILRTELSLKEQLDENTKKLLTQIIKCNSVCLHIRRGDYLQYSIYDVCNYKYYKSGMEYVLSKVENPIFFIFSDDIEWVEKNYEIPYIHYFVKGNRVANFELELMRNCKHFIISNSSFSWWAQFLTKNDEAVVVAPKPWYADERECSLYLPHWYAIDCSGGMDL